MKRLSSLLIPLLSTSIACGYIPSDLYRWTEYFARGWGLEPKLVAAVVWVESKYCPKAVSPKGAVGLGQLMPATAKSMGVNPYDPLQNLYGTARWLRGLYERHQNWTLAIAAYNAGSGAVRQWRGVPPFRETQNYVRLVLGTYAQFAAKSKQSSTPPKPLTLAAIPPKPTSTPTVRLASSQSPLPLAPKASPQNPVRSTPQTPNKNQPLNNSKAPSSSTKQSPSQTQQQAEFSQAPNPSESSQQNRFHVIAGTYNQLSNAIAQARHLNAFPTQLRRKGRLIQVAIGPFGRTKALEVARQLNHLGAFVQEVTLTTALTPLPLTESPTNTNHNSTSNQARSDSTAPSLQANKVPTPRPAAPANLANTQAQTLTKVPAPTKTGPAPQSPASKGPSINLSISQTPTTLAQTKQPPPAAAPANNPNTPRQNTTLSASPARVTENVPPSPARVTENVPPSPARVTQTPANPLQLSLATNTVQNAQHRSQSPYVSQRYPLYNPYKAAQFDHIPTPSKPKD